MGIGQMARRRLLRRESKAGVDDDERLAGRILSRREEVFVVARVVPDLVPAAQVGKRRQHGPVPLINDRGVRRGRADIAAQPDLMSRTVRLALWSRAAGARNDHRPQDGPGGRLEDNHAPRRGVVAGAVDLGNAQVDLPVSLIPTPPPTARAWLGSTGPRPAPRS